MCSSQSQPDIFVAVARAFKSHTEKAIGCVILDLVRTIFEDRRDTSLFTTLYQHVEGFGWLFSNDGLHTGPNDCRLFTSDTRERRAQVFFVVQRDGSDANDAGVCGGGRVEPPA